MKRVISPVYMIAPCSSSNSICIGIHHSQLLNKKIIFTVWSIMTKLLILDDPNLGLATIHTHTPHQIYFSSFFSSFLLSSLLPLLPSYLPSFISSFLSFLWPSSFLLYAFHLFFFFLSSSKSENIHIRKCHMSLCLECLIVLLPCPSLLDRH